MPWYLDPVFLPAAFGLAGVIVGGLITAGSAYFLEKRREDREYEREATRSAKEVMTAARLVGLDFRVAIAVLDTAVEQKKRLSGAPLSLAGWEQYRAIMAREVSTDDWKKLVVASTGINLVMAEFRGSGDLSPSALRGITLTAEALKAAELVIIPLMK